MKKQNYDQIFESLQKTNNLLENNAAIHYFRPPYGNYDQNVINACQSLRMDIWLWSIDPRDWQNPSPKTIVERVVNPLKGNDIVLLHDYHNNTVVALPQIIKKTLEKGFSLSKLQEEDQPHTKNEKFM
jgi:peptidoglycan/xylan/chitin deacetylase (PgdA/CDA1 family)